MAAKKTKKKNIKKKLPKNVQNEVIDETPKKSVLEKENKQLIWFFVIVVIIFGSFLVPYFWVESTKSFQYAGVDWVVEEYAEPTGTIYHGRFPAFNNPNLNFNVFFRIDPRKNNVKTDGVFDEFWSKGAISISPEADACRGELSRVMLDLGSFLKIAIGTQLDTGSTNKDVASQSGRPYVTCDTSDDRTIIIVDIGESSVVRDGANPNCYIIYAENCNDYSSTEKFIFKTIEDFVLA